jgi:hypothetical protein
MKTKAPPFADVVQDKPEPYTIVANKLIDHPDLSMAAKAVMLYLVSRPPNWNIQMADIERWGKCGEDKRQRLFKELIAAGYLEFITEHDKVTGRIRKYYQMHRNPKKVK